MSANEMMEFRILQLEEWRRGHEKWTEHSAGSLAATEEWKKNMDEWRKEQKEQWDEVQRGQRESRIAVYTTLVLVCGEIIVRLLKI